MFQVKVTNSMFIAHSLPDESFGPAQNLHGATYTIDLFISSNTLTDKNIVIDIDCLLYTSPSPRDATLSRMPSSA